MADPENPNPKISTPTPRTRSTKILHRNTMDNLKHASTMQK